MTRFGEILAELRQDRGLTQETLAKVLFVTAGTISNYENSAHFPDIEKLTALAGDRDTITENDVHAVATRSIECTVFEMVDAVVAGQRARALMLLRDMLTAGQERLGILAMLLRQYRLMQHVKIMQYEKLSRQELVKNLGIAPFAAERTMRQAQGYTGAQVRRGVGICLDTEYKVKAGQYNEDGALETAVLALLGLRG